MLVCVLFGDHNNVIICTALVYALALRLFILFAFSPGLTRCLSCADFITGVDLWSCFVSGKTISQVDLSLPR